MIDSYTAQNPAVTALNDALTDTLNEAMDRTELFSQIESDAQNGFLVPSFLDIELFAGEQVELPEWAHTVFDKEYEKQKAPLDLMAKRLYSNSGLTEVLGLSGRCERGIASR